MFGIIKNRNNFILFCFKFFFLIVFSWISVPQDVTLRAGEVAVTMSLSPELYRVLVLVLLCVLLIQPAAYKGLKKFRKTRDQVLYLFEHFWFKSLSFFNKKKVTKRLERYKKFLLFDAENTMLVLMKYVQIPEIILDLNKNNLVFFSGLTTKFLWRKKQLPLRSDH